MKKLNHLGVAMVAIGLGLNFLDRYFGGNLPFSPEASDQNNKVSLLNRFGKPPAGNPIELGTILIVVGIGLIIFKKVG